MSTDLAAFLLARYDDETSAALAATPGPWRDTGTVLAGVATDDYVTVASCNSSKWDGGEYSYPATAEEAGNAAHIARWDPARVLAECEARRRIVAEHPVEDRQAEVDPDLGEKIPDCTTDWQPYPCRTLRLLALPYSSHPDYDPAWRP